MRTRAKFSLRGTSRRLLPERNFRRRSRRRFVFNTIQLINALNSGYLIMYTTSYCIDTTSYCTVYYVYCIDKDKYNAIIMKLNAVMSLNICGHRNLPKTIFLTFFGTLYFAAINI